MKWTFAFLLTFLLGCSSESVQNKTADDKKADLHYSHGTSQLIAKNYTLALDHLLQAKSLRKDDTKILNNLGMAYYFKKDIANAIKNLKQAVESDPKNSDARNNLASIYYNLGKYAKAQKQYLSIRKDLVYPYQYRILYNLALLEFKKGNSLKAKNYLQESISENSNYCPSYFLLGRINEVAREYEEAYKNFKQSYQGVCFNNPAPHFKSAENLYFMGKYEQARVKYNEVVEKFPKSSFAALATEKVLKLKAKNLKSSTSEAYTKRMEEIENEVKSYQAPGF